jgi:hypothetical protein
MLGQTTVPVKFEDDIVLTPDVHNFLATIRQDDQNMAMVELTNQFKLKRAGKDPDLRGKAEWPATITLIYRLLSKFN